MSISKRTRFEIFKRDRFQCQYCGRTPPTVVLHVDHILPVSKGGPDEKINLVTACVDCNLGKSNVLLNKASVPLAQQMKEEEERKAQIEGFNAFIKEKRDLEDRQIHQLGVIWFETMGISGCTFGYGLIPSVRNFLRRMPYEQIVEAIETAHCRVPTNGRTCEKTWKYFCGICWRVIKRAEGEE